MGLVPMFDNDHNLFFFLGVFDPAVIGDKGKWYCHQLEPIYFDVWSESCTLTTSMAAMGLTDEASTGRFA